MNLYKPSELNNQYTANSFDIINKYSNLTIIDLLKDRKITFCPHCNSTKIIKYGKYKGLQRFKCLNATCKKTFSQKTKTFISHSKKAADLWAKYFVLMNNGYSLRDCSSILNINLATAFFWRHKILVTQNKNHYNTLKNYVEISKIMIKENFKGDKNAKNRRKENVSVACAMDSNKTLLSKVISRYSLSLGSINKHFSYNIDNSSILASYNDRYLEIYSKQHNSTVLPLPKDKISSIANDIKNNNLSNNNENSIIAIKNLNSTIPTKCLFIHNFSLQIKKWLVRFRGVATKYLENYLNWNILEFRNKYKTYSLNQIDLLKNFLNEFSYIKISDFSDYKLLFEIADF